MSGGERQGGAPSAAGASPATGASAATGASQTAPSAFMARALELAQRGLYTTHPNPRVGCVLERDGAIVGEGWHARAGEPHAEVMAVRAAGAQARGATVHVTLEPCSHTGRTPPCADALIAAGVAQVVCASVDPNPRVAGRGIERLRAAGVPVTVGVASAAARALNVGFFSRFERGRPYVRLKLAMSVDARTAPAADGPRWITGEAARADVQTWRARSSAVLTGAGTVRVDDPQLTVRLAYGPWVRQPLRVVLDPDLTCAPGSKVFENGPALVVAAPSAGGVAGAPTLAAGVQLERVPRAAGGLDLKAVLECLQAREVNELLVECGPRLAASFLGADLVDELILYVAPVFLGADAPPLAALHGLAGTGATGAGTGVPSRFAFCEQRLFPPDLRLILTPTRG